MINKIAIIIVTYNGSKWIQKCLASVFKSTYENFDVIVVDNASDDESVRIVREFKDSYGRNAHLIELKENKGFVGGNNVGIGYAVEQGCDAVVLLNQDTEVEPECLNHLVDVARDDDVGIVQAMMLLGNERKLTNNMGNAMHYLGFGFVKHYREQANQWLNQVEPLEIGYASGAAMLIKKDVLSVIAREGTPDRGNLTDAMDMDDKDNNTQRDDKIASSANTPPRNDTSYLDSKFFAYHEDLDLCWRARLAGYKIMIAPKAVIYHYYEFNRNKKMFYWTEKNRWCVLLQNYQLGTLVMLLPMLFLIELMMILYSTASGWLLHKLKSYVWIAQNIRAILSKRREVQAVRKVDDKAILKHMDEKLEFSEVSNPLLKYIVSPIVEFYFKIIK